MVLARAPLRVSLAGGGTDLPSYAAKFGGRVVSVAINRYVGVVVHPREFSGRLRVTTDTIDHSGHINDLPDPVARACLRRVGLTGAARVATFGDAPSGSGLGGSGALTVSLVHATHVGLSRREIAERASAVEMTDLGRPVGKQDHYMAAYGGLRLLDFHEDGRVDVRDLGVEPPVVAALDQRLLLFHTGGRHDSGSVLSEQVRRTLLGEPEVLGLLHRIRELADEMVDCLLRGAVDEVGGLLDAHWAAKSRLGSRVSTGRAERLWAEARAAGATGGKLLGAGGGGFLLVHCPPERQDDLRRAMRALDAAELPFGFAPSGSMVARLPV
uniref:AmgD n=1 Tax=Streptomyces sp. KCTC 9047 TaxID=648015 RepID=C5HYQ8_9ACTN|nr:AmgD [Streptomyces sp. KCTC 9047]